MKAIETTYQGVRFRSRLEARWAVFFDAMGIKWEYEPQGFEFESRLNPTSGQMFHYLPDFRFPELDLWAEVKGSLNADECRRLLECASALSASRRGGCTGPENDVVVLGPFDSRHGGKPWFPTLLHFHKGDLMAGPWAGRRGGDSYGDISVARDCGEYGLMYGEDDALGQTIQLLLGGWAVGMRWLDNEPQRVAPSQTWADALDRARSARFEHGEQPMSTPISGKGAFDGFIAEIRVLLGPDAFPPSADSDGVAWFLANYRYQHPNHIAEIEAVREACGV